MLLQFKHYMSTIDFPATKQRNGMPPPFPPPKHRTRCINSDCRLYYGTFTIEDVRHNLGFDADQVLHDGIFEVKGLRIGLEICLDHLVGELVKQLGTFRSVDVHLISSAGMNIANGPVATPQGGPIFLADGHSRTAMSLNMFGRGRDASKLLDGHLHYDVGVVYGADSLTALSQWASSVIYAFAGSSFAGERTTGYGTLPGGIDGHGAGFNFTQIDALGENWYEMLSGVFDVASYEEARHLFSLVSDDVKKRLETDHLRLFGRPGKETPFFPTVDVYGPIALK